MNSLSRFHFTHLTLTALAATAAMAGCSVYDPALLRSPNDVPAVDMGGPVDSGPDTVDVPNPPLMDVADVPTIEDVGPNDVPTMMCPAGQTPCNGACVDLLSDTMNCGRCNVACPPVTNGVAQCSMGTCQPMCNAAFAPYDARTCVPPLTEPCPANGTPPAIIQPNIAHVRTGLLTGRRADLTFNSATCNPMTVLGPDEVYALSSPVTASFRAELFTEGFDAAIAARPNVCASAGPSDQCFNSVARAGREALTTPNVNAGSTSFFVAKSTSAITGAYALVVTPISTCGNRTIDGAEECDDGNVDDGDGCNASCRVTATIGESCDPAMAQPIVANYGNELYRINLSGMRDALSLPCNPQRALETIVYLRAAGSGKIRVQSRDAIVGIYPTNCAVGVAPASCGTMLGPAEVTSVVAGNVYALVLEPRVLGTRQADLTIDLAQCGNNNVETSYAEGCDDGNNVNGDGCSSACIREAVCNVSWPGGAAAATFADPARPPFNRCSIVPFTGMITGNNPAATTSSVTAITLGQGDLVTATISRTAGAGGIFGVEILNSPMMGSTTTACSSGPNALNCATSMGSVNSVTWASPLGGNYYIRFFTNTIMGSDFLGSIVVTRAPRL